LRRCRAQCSVSDYSSELCFSGKPVYFQTLGVHVFLLDACPSIIDASNRPKTQKQWCIDQDCKSRASRGSARQQKRKKTKASG